MSGELFVHIAVGKEVKFDPFAAMAGFAIADNQGEIATGKIVSVNYPHKWFSVEFDCYGVKQRTSFKFCQVGKDVMICG